MELEKVKNPQFSVLIGRDTENNYPFSAMADTTVGIGIVGILIEIFRNQDMGILLNATLIAAMFFGAMLGNMPEYSKPNSEKFGIET